MLLERASTLILCSFIYIYARYGPGTPIVTPPSPNSPGLATCKSVIPSPFRHANTGCLVRGTHCNGVPIATDGVRTGNRDRKRPRQRLLGPLTPPVSRRRHPSSVATVRPTTGCVQRSSHPLVRPPSTNRSGFRRWIPDSTSSVWESVTDRPNRPLRWLVVTDRLPQSVRGRPPPVLRGDRGCSSHVEPKAARH